MQAIYPQLNNHSYMLCGQHFFWIHLHEMDYEILFLHLKVQWDNCDNATSFPA